MRVITLYSNLEHYSATFPTECNNIDELAMLATKDGLISGHQLNSGAPVELTGHIFSESTSVIVTQNDNDETSFTVTAHKAHSCLMNEDLERMFITYLESQLTA